MGLLASLLGVKTLIGAPGIATGKAEGTVDPLGHAMSVCSGSRGRDPVLLGVCKHATRLGALGIATKTKDATRGSRHRY